MRCDGQLSRTLHAARRPTDYGFLQGAIEYPAPDLERLVDVDDVDVAVGTSVRPPAPGPTLLPKSLLRTGIGRPFAIGFGTGVAAAIGLRAVNKMAEAKSGGLQ